MSKTIILPDGRVFPCYEGEALCWDLNAYNTIKEEQEGFPRMRVVIQAMKAHRPEQLAVGRLLLRARAKRDAIRDSLGCMFGHNARKTLAVLKEEGV